jgi:hypothetical protein
MEKKYGGLDNWLDTMFMYWMKCSEYDEDYIFTNNDTAFLCGCFEAFMAG